MKLIIDTSVLSLALRRSVASPEQAAVAAAAARDQLIIVTVVRQELLTGARTPEQYDRI